MISNCDEILRGARTRVKPGGRASRRFRPAIDGTPRLEARELMRAGPHLGHAPALVHKAVPPAADPTVELQQALAASYTEGPGNVAAINTRDAAILVPSGLVPGHTYPLVVAFAYNGSPGVPFQVWWNQAEKNDWLVYASRDFQNSVLHAGLGASESVAGRVKAQVAALSTTLPIDYSRIILTGMSGGANYADFMNLYYPGYAAGVIINSGRIPDQLFSNTPRPGFLTMPTASEFNGSRRLGVFLASPTDSQFFGITQSNSKFMQTLGWDTTFLSFVGGHWNAPPATYDRAIAWIESQPSWTSNP